MLLSAGPSKSTYGEKAASGLTDSRGRSHQHALDPCRRLILNAGKYMRISLQRKGNARVPKLLGNNLHGDAGSYGKCGGRMTIMPLAA